MTIMTKRQLIAAYNRGWLEEVAKEVRRYGKITKDGEFEIEEGFHKGCHRVMLIKHKALEWEIHYHNGEVKTLGYFPG